MPFNPLTKPHSIELRNLTKSSESTRPSTFAGSRDSAKQTSRAETAKVYQPFSVSSLRTQQLTLQQLAAQHVQQKAERSRFTDERREAFNTFKIDLAPHNHKAVNHDVDRVNRRVYKKSLITQILTAHSALLSKAGMNMRHDVFNSLRGSKIAELESVLKFVKAQLSTREAWRI